MSRRFSDFPGSRRAMPRLQHAEAFIIEKTPIGQG